MPTRTVGRDVAPTAYDGRPAEFLEVCLWKPDIRAPGQKPMRSIMSEVGHSNLLRSATQILWCLPTATEDGTNRLRCIMPAQAGSHSRNYSRPSERWEVVTGLYPSIGLSISVNTGPSAVR
jgi:hypothetical protein